MAAIETELADRTGGTRYLTWGLIALELILCAFIVWDLSGYTPDDAYIYLNGARQLAGGHLPNMTPGEVPTNAWSSLLWVGLVTPAYWLGINALVWAKLLGFILLLGIVWQIARIIGLFHPKLDQATVWAVAGLTLVYMPLVFWATSGMETILYVFSLVLVFRLLLRDTLRRRLSVGLGLALSVHLVTRPDAFINAALVLVLLVILVLNPRRTYSWSGLVRPALGLLPGIVLLLLPGLFYPTVLPTSALAKSLALTALFSDQFWWNLRELVLNFALTPGNVFIFAGMLIFVFARRRTEEPTVGWELRGFVLLLVLTHLGERVLVCDWMAVQRLWLESAVIALAVCLPALVRLTEKKRHLLISAVILCGSLAAGLLGWRVYIFCHYSHAGDPAEVMGRFIEGMKRDDSWMLATDMGVVPYFGDINTIDVESVPICNYHLMKVPDDSAYVWSHRVDFVVVTSPYVTAPRPGATEYRLLNEALGQRTFWENYRHVLSAEWRAPFDDGIIRPTPGRYYHLFVSNRIECDLPSPPILLTRNLMAWPVAAEAVLPVELPSAYTADGVVPAVPDEPLPGYLVPPH